MSIKKFTIPDEADAISIFMRDLGWTVNKWYHNVYGIWANARFPDNGMCISVHITSPRHGGRLIIYPETDSSSVDKFFDDELVNPDCLKKFGDALCVLT